MSGQSLHRLQRCPNCSESSKNWDWITWCSKCGVTVCSKCVKSVHDCKDGFHFGIPGRGTRYFNTLSLQEEITRS
jgi:hypothetical protein